MLKLFENKCSLGGNEYSHLYTFVFLELGMSLEIILQLPLTDGVPRNERRKQCLLGH